MAAVSLINQHEFEPGKPVRRSSKAFLESRLSRAFSRPYRVLETLFMPSGLYIPYSSDHIVARLLVHAIAILFPPLLAILGFFLVIGPDQFESGPRAIALSAASTMAIWFGITLYLIRIGKSLPARLAFCTFVSIFCFAIIQITGGVLNSVATPFVFIPPLICFYFYGHRIGAMVSFAIFPLAILINAMNQFAGRPIPNATSMANPYLNQLISNGTVYIVIAVSLYSMLKSIHVMRTTLFSQQAKLKVLANKDDLTGIANSRALTDQLNERCTAADRFNLKFGVVYVDLDQFKPINDNHGHRIGDEVLIEIARRLRTFCQLDDCVARLGGDEFVLIINRVTDDNSGVRLIDAIKSMIELPLKTGDLTISLTASVGYSIYGDQLSEPDQLIIHADKNMYEDKQTKRPLTA
jgi:diguanylate cyclase (GGDEF)-like protein